MPGVCRWHIAQGARILGIIGVSVPLGNFSVYNDTVVESERGTRAARFRIGN